MWKTAGVLSKYLCKNSEQSTFWAKQISDSGLRDRFVPRNIVYTPDSVCLHRCQQSDCIKSFGRERVSTVLWFILEARCNAPASCGLLFNEKLLAYENQITGDTKRTLAKDT